MERLAGGCRSPPWSGWCSGSLIERLVVRPLYARPLDAILATWGLGIVIGQLITIGFGREVQFVQSPVSGAIAFLGQSYSLYRLLLVVVAVALGGALAALLYCTRFGLTARAVIMNEDLARGLGIDSDKVRLVTFGLGAALASMAGALITPLLAGRSQHGPAVAGQLVHAGAGIGRLARRARARLRSFWAARRWWSAPTSARSSAA